MIENRRPESREKGCCPKCGTKLLFAELVLDMWCPKCRKYLDEIKRLEGKDALQ